MLCRKKENCTGDLINAPVLYEEIKERCDDIRALQRVKQKPPWNINDEMKQMDTPDKTKITNISRNAYRINDKHMKDFAIFISKWPLPNLTLLWLGNNNIGDGGMQAFASALAMGSLPKLEKLFLYSNSIGDAGMKAFASAVASGSLPKLEELYLEQNKIGAGSTFSWKNYDFFSNKHFQHNHMIT